MSERSEESQDWPLRDWAARLHAPERDDDPPEAEPDPEPDAADFAPDPFEAAVVPARPEIPLDPQPVAPLDAAPAAEAVAVEEEVAPAYVPVEEHAAGEFRVPDGYAILEGAPNGSRRSVAVVVSRFNADVTNRLLASALDELEECGVARDAVLVMPVPGAFELPLAALALAKTRRYACVVALGCVIRGETPHFDFVASEAASGLQLAAIETGVPVAFGVLTLESPDQAEPRIEKGAEAARSALEMADVFAQLRAHNATRAASS